jgi:hypothetical protein
VAISTLFHEAPLDVLREHPEVLLELLALGGVQLELSRPTVTVLESTAIEVVPAHRHADFVAELRDRTEGGMEGEARGRAEGEARGRAEGEARTLLKLLASGASRSTRPLPHASSPPPRWPRSTAGSSGRSRRGRWMRCSRTM